MKKKTENREVLGDRLQELIDEYGTSPEKIAPIAKVSSVQIRAIIKGTMPHRTTIDKIAAALGTTADYLISGTGEKLPDGKRDISQSVQADDDPWKNEAWILAKNQIVKKDATIEMLSTSFERLTKFLDRVEGNFLQVVKETGT